MPQPHVELLRSSDLRAAINAVGDIVDAAGDMDGFVQVGVRVLDSLVASEFATMSRCDLASGRRIVFGVPPGTIGEHERAAFDRHFHEHPLVLYHAVERGSFAHRISDSLSPESFRATALYNEYYRRVGLSHALALPIRMDGRELVSFVLNRQRLDFTDTELALLDVLRRPLAQVFGRLCAAQRPAPSLDPGVIARHALTPREAEVLQWVACGKTDRDAAALLNCSPRTVHKHLQRVYAKFGVETRTAAVMRAVARR